MPHRSFLCHYLCERSVIPPPEVGYADPLRYLPSDSRLKLTTDLNRFKEIFVGRGGFEPPAFHSAGFTDQWAQPITQPTHEFGTPSGIRTHNLQILNLTPLPVRLPRHKAQALRRYNAALCFTILGIPRSPINGLPSNTRTSCESTYVPGLLPTRLEIGLSKWLQEPAVLFT